MRTLICFSTCVNQMCYYDCLTIKLKIHWCLFCKRVYAQLVPKLESCAIHWVLHEVQLLSFLSQKLFSFSYSRIGIKSSFFNFQSQPLRVIARGVIQISIPSSPISQDLISIDRMPLDPLVEEGGGDKAPLGFKQTPIPPS